MAPDVAEDGEKAVAFATQKFCDVVFMDIQMPGIDGLTACTEIHKTAKNTNTPVVFVTVLSDFQTRAESVVKGGCDLMAKPFLMVEITVKAQTYAMRKRLQLQQSLSKQTFGAGFSSEAAHPPHRNQSAARIARRSLRDCALNAAAKCAAGSFPRSLCHCDAGVYRGCARCLFTKQRARIGVIRELDMQSVSPAWEGVSCV